MQDLHKAMKMLGLNPTEQEVDPKKMKAKNVKFIFQQVVDIPNEIAKSGHIYFPEFCKLVLDRFRQISNSNISFSV